MGAAGGTGGSPVSYIAVIGILGLSILVFGFIREQEFEGFEIAYTAGVVLMFVTVYLVVAFHVLPGEFTPGWILRIREYYLPEGYAFRAILGTIVGLLLVVRGVRLSLVQFPEKSFNLTFRAGLLFMGVAAIVDLLVEEQLNVFVFMILFFGAGLAGLNLGHLVPESAASVRSRTWTKVIAGGAIATVTIGLFFIGISRGIFAVVTDPLQAFFLHMAKGLAIIVGFPLFAAYGVINRAVENFFGDEEFIGEFGGANPFPDEATTTLPFNVSSTEVGAVTSAGADFVDPELLTRIFVFVLIFVVASLILAFLYFVLKKLAPEALKNRAGNRESITEEVDIGSDLWDFLKSLIPNFNLFNRGQGYHIPEGQPGVVEALKLYYEMLTTA